MKNSLIGVVLFFLVGALALHLAAPVSVMAMSDEQQQEFDRILKLKMGELTKEAADLLDEKYPDEDWDAHEFPEYVFTSESVEIGYMIAVVEPEVLTINACYCFCDAMGHESLLNCFVKKKKPMFGSRFDDHGADCTICYGEAMLAFLWKNMGATDQEIVAGMEKKFERLLKAREKGQH